MSDPGDKIGGSFAERLTQLYQTVREAGSQETLDTVRRLGQELGSGGVDGFIGSFSSIAEGDKTFLKNLFAGQAGDPDAAALGAKNLLTREMWGQLKHRQIEIRMQDADSGQRASRHVSELEKRGFNPQPEPPGDLLPQAKVAGSKSTQKHVSELEKRGFNPQPEPPGDFIPPDNKNLG